MAAVIANHASGVSGEGAPRLLVGTGSDRRHLVVVMTSDRGLAGGFNTSIVRAARERITKLQGEGTDVRVLTVGRKARDQLRRLYSDKSVGEFEAGGNPSLERAEEVAVRIRELFDAGEVDVVTLFYSRFASVISQVPSARQLIPAEVQAGGPVVDLKGASYEYEPDEAGILEALLPRNLTTQVFSAMLENQAGFFAAQMTAMDNATRNAGDMIASLTLQMNRARQAQITKELIEIISGAEAI
jgi:F-type H+-transporting ATPase subunit gamma